jgi:hypothetical protein
MERAIAMPVDAREMASARSSMERMMNKAQPHEPRGSVAEYLVVTSSDKAHGDSK